MFLLLFFLLKINCVYLLIKQLYNPLLDGLFLDDDIIFTAHWCSFAESVEFHPLVQKTREQTQAFQKRSTLKVASPHNIDK